MCSNFIVIASIGSQDSAQMHLAEDNDVVHTFTPDRSDQPFGKAILPRRGWCGRLVPDAHGAHSACDDAAIDPVAIADQVARGLIPRKCLRYLTCNPFRRRICCDVDPDEVSAVEPDDDEGIEQVETDRDRKSTRLNSSHANISYAVFCLKKKNYNGHFNKLTDPAPSVTIFWLY